MQRPTTRRMMRFLYRAGRIVSLGLLLLAVGLGGGIWWLNSTDGRLWLIHEIETAAGDNHLVIRDLGGTLPFAPRIGHASLADRTGVWLDIDGLVVTIDPGALLKRTLHIEAVSIDRLTLIRTPEAAVTSDLAVPDSQPGIPDFHLPALPIGIILDAFTLNRATLGPTLGHTDFTATARGAVSAGQATLTLDLHETGDQGRTGGSQLQFSGSITEEGDASKIGITLAADAPAGHFPVNLLIAAGLLGPDRGGDQGGDRGGSVHVTLEGPLAAATGDVDLETHGEGDATPHGLHAHLATTRDGDGYGIAVTGTIDPGLAGNAIPALPPIDFDGAIARTPDGMIGLDHLTLVTRFGTLSARGWVRPAQATGSLFVSTTIDLGAAGPIVAPDRPLGGTVTVDAGIDSAEAGIARYDLTIVGHALTVAAQRLEIDSHITGDLTPDRCALAGNGHLVGLQMGGLPPSLTTSLPWDIAADYNRTTGTLHQGHLAAGGLDLAVEGHRAGGGLAGRATLVVPDLGPWQTVLGLPITGRGQVTVEAASPDFTDWMGTLAARLDAAHFGTAPLDGIIGPTPTLDFAYRARTGGTSTADLAHTDLAHTDLTLTDLAVTGARFTGHGDGHRAPDGRIGARIDLTVPTLTPLGPILGLPPATSLHGALALALTAAGPATDPALAVEITGTGIAVGPTHLGRISLAAQIPAPSRRTALIKSTVDLPGGALGLSASLAQLATGEIGLRDVILTGPGLSGGGDARFTPQDGTAAGRLAVTAATLAPYARLFGVDLDGAAHLTLVLTGGRLPQADLTLGLDGVRAATGSGPDLRLKSLRGTLHLDRPLARDPQGTATLTADEIRVADLAITHARLAATPGTRGRYGLTLDLQGHRAETQALTLSTAADLDLAPEGPRLTLNRLTGILDQGMVKSLKPALFEQRGDGFGLTGLTLAIGPTTGHGGQGTIAIDAMINPTTRSLHLKAQDLALGTLSRLFTPGTPLSGRLGVDLDLTGPIARPTGHAVATLAEFRLDATANRPPFALTASADLAGDPSGVPGQSVIALKGRLDGAASLGFTASLPIELTADGAVSLPPDRPIAGLIEGEGEMASLGPLLALGEDRLAGHYRLGLKLGGTTAHPEAGGNLSIADGLYDNHALGLTLRGMSLELIGDRQAFTIQHFAATDGGRGTIRFDGGVTLAGGPVLAVAGTVNDFAVARRDELMARASGSIRLTGPLAHPSIAGTVTIDRADVAIPDELPASVVKLDVVRINTHRPRPAEVNPAAEPPAAPVFLADLAIDLQIPRRTFVRGRGLDSEWRGDLQIGGTTANPAITGDFETVTGTFDVLGKVFRLRRGILNFQGGNIPRLDLLAEAQAGDITAQVQLQGDPTQPQLKLTSTPELPSDEVLARVLFGTGLGQITPAQGLQLAQAAATLAGGGPSVLDRVRRFVGLDRLSFGQDDNPKPAGQTTSDSKGTLDGAKVSAGKYVAPGVFIGLDQGASVGSSRARIEVEVAPNVIVNGTAGAETGSNSLGLSYKRDF